MLEDLGRLDEAAAAYRAALDQVGNEAERDFLAGRLDAVERRRRRS